MSDSNSYLQFLRLYADFDGFSIDNATFFTAIPISPRKQGFTLTEFLYVPEDLSCCPDSVYFINDSYIVQFVVTRRMFYYLSDFPGECTEFQKLEYHGNNSLLVHCNETVLILTIDPCRNMIIGQALIGAPVALVIVATFVVTVVATIAVSILHIWRKSRG